MPTGLQLLQSARLTTIIQALEDPRLLPQALRFSQRVLDSDSFDGEILARDIGRVLVADIIADDQRAAVYSTGKVTTETFAIPNLKLGINFTQEQLNQFQSIGMLGGLPSGNDPGGLYNGTVDNIIRERLRRVELGIRHRKEALIIAMQLDNLAYNRMGIKITGTWGMPADLKVVKTGGATWDNVGALPLTDIRTMQRLGRVRYGENYNRVTMSTQAFMYMIATTEFQSQARAAVIQYGATATAFPNENLGYMQKIANLMLADTEIELYDARYWSQAPDGTITSTAFLPITSIILSDRADDGNRSVMDVANSIVTESIVSSIAGSAATGGVIGGLTGGPQRGPVSWAEGSLNPPQITLWGVARAFPRKMRLQSTATITVGGFTDTIAVGEPF
jgi:hypothetical protein